MHATPLALALSLLAAPLSAQLGNVDQHCLRGTDALVLGVGQGYVAQQQVVAGSSGVLTGVEFWHGGNQGDAVAVRVRRGPVPSSEPVLWEGVHVKTALLGFDVPLLDPSAAGIQLAQGEVYTLEFELLDANSSIGGVNADPPCYTEPASPTPPALTNLRWAFRTFLDDPTPGQAYCVPSPSTAGGPARMWATGSTSIAANDLQLVAGPMPDAVALFYYGTSSQQLPAGNGFACVGGVLARLPGQFPHCGTLTQHLDWTQVPAFAAQPGSTLYAQAWFRDPYGGGGPANYAFSEGYEVTLTP